MCLAHRAEWDWRGLREVRGALSLFRPRRALEADGVGRAGALEEVWAEPASENAKAAQARPPLPPSKLRVQNPTHGV